MKDIVALTDKAEAGMEPKKRGSYKPRQPKTAYSDAKQPGFPPQAGR